MSGSAQTDEPRYDDAPLRFERRNSDRWPMSGAATAFRIAGERFGQIHELKMLDYSDHGLGAYCDSVIEPGTIITVGFQTPGCPTKRGTVLRCRPCGSGYQIGIQFQGRMAA